MTDLLDLSQVEVSITVCLEDSFGEEHELFHILQKAFVHQLLLSHYIGQEHILTDNFWLFRLFLFANKSAFISTTYQARIVLRTDLRLIVKDSKFLLAQAQRCLFLTLIAQHPLGRIFLITDRLLVHHSCR